MFTPGARKARLRSQRKVLWASAVARPAQHAAQQCEPELEPYGKCFVEEHAEFIAPEFAAPEPEALIESPAAEPVLELTTEDVSADQDEFVLGADDVLAADAMLPPLGPPEPFELNPAELLQISETGLIAPEADEEIPFDAPEEDDEIFQQRRVIYDPAGDAALQLNKKADALAGARAHQDEHVRAAPPISVLVRWEREDVRALVQAAARDRRLARAEFTFEPNTVAEPLSAELRPLPDLIILDSTASRERLLDQAAELTPLVRRGAKVVMLGAVNDINLLRDLAARGVSEYVMPPIEPEEFVRTLCRLYADGSASRIIAVIGARGGVGASTIAHNLAWSIAERQQQPAALVDFDLAFGTAAFAFNQAPAQSITSILTAPEHADDELLDDIVVRPTQKLRIFSAPASVDRTLRLDPRAVEHTLSHVRRTSSWLVLDLPHDWTGWIKQALLTADQTIIVATPDLAGLAAAKNMLEALRAARPNCEPHFVLSMAGVPKRPEIAAKEFAEALGATPMASFAFDPELVGKAAVSAQMIGEVAPASKMAQQIDDLAAALTGAEIIAEASAPKPVMQAAEPERVSDDPSVPGALRRLKLARGVIVRRPQAETERYLDQARRAAAAQFAKKTPQAPARRRGASPALRVASLATAIVALVAWNIEGRRSEAQASAPAVATTTAHVAPAATPAPRNPAAEYEAAALLLETDAAAALPALQVLADEGFVPAQYRLAKAYEHGEGVDIDLVRARQWTERAANAGDARAMHDLGVYFARGDGGPINETAAFRWFRRAAAQGIADSQYNLGVLYEQGRGVSEDTAEALFWYELAARNGDQAAAERAQALAAHIAPLEAERARLRAAAFR